MSAERVRIVTFNEQPADEALEALRPVCGSAAWQRVLVASRPFVSIGELAATSEGVLLAMGWSDVQEVLAQDGRTGVPALAGSEEAVTYEARFGVPFVIDPVGKTLDDVRAALATRLANEEDVEQRTVRRELAAIVRSRLATRFG